MEPIKLLIVDADELASNQLVRALIADGLAIASERADTLSGIEVALRWFEPDIVLSRAGVPGLDAGKAIELVRALSPRLPFVFILDSAESSLPEAARQRATDTVLLADRARLAQLLRGATVDSRLQRSVQRAERALKNSETRFHMFMENLPGAAYIKDLDGRFTYLNGVCERLMGRSADQVIGRRLDQFFQPEVAGEYAENDQRALMVRQQIEAVEEMPTPDGPRTFLSIKFPLLDADGDAVMVGGISIDISGRVEEERRLARLARLHAMLGAVNAAVVRATTRESLFQEACRAAVDAGGFRMAWIGLAGAGRAQVEPVASYGHEIGYLDEVRRALAATAEERHLTGWSVQIVSWDSGLAAETVRRGQVIVCEDIATDPRIAFRQAALDRGFASLVALPLSLHGEAIGMMMMFADEVGACDDNELVLLRTMASDISFGLEYLHATQQLSTATWYDILTGLANRQLFVDRLTQMLAEADPAQPAASRGSVAPAKPGGEVASNSEPNRQPNTSAAVSLLLFDLRRFHEVNRRIGRSAADQVLKAFAARLKSVFRGVGTVSRVDGDQFAVAVRDLRPALLATLGSDRWDGSLSAPIEVDGTAVQLSFKLGIATAPGDGENAEQLMLAAETALREAKASADAYVHHSPGLSALAVQRQQLESRLREAVERDEFVLHYLPKVDLRSREVVGVEALIRWYEADREPSTAAEFIAVLEDMGFGDEIGRWTLQQAAADLRRWQAGGLPALRVSVNVSLAQVCAPDFVGKVLAALGGPKGAASGFDLEITETHVAGDEAATVEKLHQIRGLGIGIALDDFGTGQSSLSQLARLPVDAVKIDRSLVADLDGSRPESVAIVSAIIGMTKALGRVTVAEGVESEATARLLLELGCDQAQGFLFGRPQTAAELVQALAAGRSVAPG